MAVSGSRRTRLRGRQAVDVVGGVDTQQLLASGRPRREGDEVPFDPSVAQPELHRVEPLGAFGMPGPGVVLAEDRVVAEPDALHRR
jgi:hypothetical protein